VVKNLLNVDFVEKVLFVFSYELFILRCCP